MFNFRMHGYMCPVVLTRSGCRMHQLDSSEVMCGNGGVKPFVANSIIYTSLKRGTTDILNE